MITLAFGITFCYDEHHTLINNTSNTDITGWHLIHKKIENTLSNNPELFKSLKLFRYGNGKYCLAIKIYKETGLDVALPINKLYQDYTNFDLTPFKLLFDRIGLPSSMPRYKPQILALTN